MVLTFHALSDIAPSDWVTLLNHPDVARHMPLAGSDWDEAKAADWSRAKDFQWQQNGYGPWAIRIDGKFAGWGGFQKEGDEADLGLVLLPEFWGHGAEFFRACLERREELGVGAVTILLPPSRVRMKGLGRLGFEPDGEIEYAGHRFLKFRLAG